MTQTVTPSVTKPLKAPVPLDARRGLFWRRFRANKVAWISSWLFMGLLLFSALANVTANDRPVVMKFYGQWFFPAFFDYLPSKLYQPPQDLAHPDTDGDSSWSQQFVVDYWSIQPDIEQHGWALWPLLNQRPFESNLDFPELPAPPGSRSQFTLKSPISQVEHQRNVTHILGTDTSGRDLLTRIIYGCRTSLLMAVVTTLLAMFFGVALGLVMGFWGGWFDMIMGRILEAIGYFPVIFMIIILVAFLENPGISGIIAIFVLLNLAPFAFYMRGQVLSVRRLAYIEAARSLGQRPWSIMFKHILPNSFGPIMVLVPFSITSDISFLATIDFLGFGVQPPTASLGSILRSGFDQIEQRWWLVLDTSLVLIGILVLINFIGDGVRDGLDPHAQPNKKAFQRWVNQQKAKATDNAPHL